MTVALHPLLICVSPDSLVSSSSNCLARPAPKFPSTPPALSPIPPAFLLLQVTHPSSTQIHLHPSASTAPQNFHSLKTKLAPTISIRHSPPAQTSRRIRPSSYKRRSRKVESQSA